MFDLALSLRSGQYFRYYEKDGWFYVTHKEYFFRVRQVGDRLESDGAPVGVVRRFFGLDQPYEKMVSSFDDGFVQKLVQDLRGLRVLQQDPWECLCAFVLSSASNIPRITKNVAVLSTGKRLTCGDEVSRAFPRPGELSEEAMKEARLGYRTDFLRTMNKTVNEQWLRALENESYDGVLQQLMSLKGVGEKIGDCVALFSLQKFEAFPVDVWIARIMREKYTGELPLKHIKGFGQSYFGKYAGYAQQFLYEWVRMQKK